MHFCQSENALQLNIDFKDIIKKKVSRMRMDSRNTSEMKQNKTQFFSVQIWYFNIALFYKNVWRTVISSSTK